MELKTILEFAREINCKVGGSVRVHKVPESVVIQKLGQLFFVDLKPAFETKIARLVCDCWLVKAKVSNKRQSLGEQ